MKNTNKGRIPKKAFITGISGQDGYYLSHFLATTGYEIAGLIRNKESKYLVDWISGARDKIKIYVGDLTDANLIRSILSRFKPDEIYNLAAVSDLAASFKDPELTMKVNCEAPGKMIEHALEIISHARIFLASSAQIFDKSNPPQSETSRFKTESPYAVAKLKLHQQYVVPFRSKGLFVCSGFLFNHESPRREERFVTRKITSSLVGIKKGALDCLELGNLDAIRDWGFAGDYAEAMWLMMQQPKPDDYVIATGVPHSVRDFVKMSARHLGIKLKWQGSGLNEVGLDQNGKIVIRINPDFYRQESGYFLGDISKIKKDLSWEPKVSFEKLVEMMVEADSKC